MDRNLYKALILTLSVSPLCVTYAQTPANCNPASVGIELTGGWFRGMTNDAGFAIQAQNATDVPPSGSLLRVTPKNEFDGAIALSYDFPASPFTLALTWWRVHSNTSNAANGSIGITQTPAAWEYDFATATTSNLDYENDILTLALGATFYLDCPVKVTPQLGVSYLHIKNNQSTTYAGNNIVAGSLVTVNEDSSFKGYGPSFGIDVDYLLISHISLFGKFLYSAFLGDVDANYNPVQSGTVVQSSNVDMDSDHQIVNLIQTELGFSYHFTCVNYKSQVLVGYAFAKIFGGSVNNAYFGDDISDSLFTSSTTDLGFQGPFARFSINFDL